ncbi:MAG: serine/threonine protein kinase [Victivallales bacterium]|nr:serine/threonine protein kinase [Victivallales bacterium]
MSDVISLDPTVVLDDDGSIGAADFNRTVILASDVEPEQTSLPQALHEEKKAVPAPRSREVEDMVKGVDINPFISSTLDVSSVLRAPLEHVDTKYARLEELASGGTATISIARDKNLSRLVAIKSLKQGVKNHEAQLRTFVEEAKVTAQLDHPGIIPIYGISNDEGDGIHLVMKLVNGKTLREYLRNISLNYRTHGMAAFDETMMLQKRLEIFLRVCDTIAYAHSRNVIHRDLKPENIMIGKFMEVYVMDWGLAKVVLEDEQVYERLSGTPRYFAPEVLRHECLDKRSDIFTLGLILQEVVTLQYAVTGNDEKELMNHILNGELESIEHEFHRKIDKYLQAIIEKATAYMPDDRYQTVNELAEDIRRYLAHRSISAKPDNLFRKCVRFLFGYRF